MIVSRRDNKGTGFCILFLKAGKCINNSIRFVPVFGEVNEHALHKVADVPVEECPFPLVGNHASNITQSLIKEWVTKQIVYITAIWHSYTKAI